MYFYNIAIKKTLCKEKEKSSNAKKQNKTQLVKTDKLVLRIRIRPYQNHTGIAGFGSDRRFVQKISVQKVAKNHNIDLNDDILFLFSS